MHGYHVAPAFNPCGCAAAAYRPPAENPIGIGWALLTLGILVAGGTAVGVTVARRRRAAAGPVLPPTTPSPSPGGGSRGTPRPSAPQAPPATPPAEPAEPADQVAVNYRGLLVFVSPGLFGAQRIRILDKAMVVHDHEGFFPSQGAAVQYGKQWIDQHAAQA